MNPADVPVRDWPLYYNSTWMLYQNKYHVAVNVNRHEGRTVLEIRHKDFVKVLWRKEHLRKCLSPWWPRAGSYNHPKGHAAYVARKANRCMRKSCCPPSHYYIKWGNKLLKPLSFLTQENAPPISWAEGKADLDSLKRTSVAIGRDLIFTFIKPETYQVIYRGDEAGIIKLGEFTSANDFSPITKLAYNRLIREGVV